MKTQRSADRMSWLAWCALVTSTAAVLGLLGALTLDWPKPAWLGLAYGALSIPVAWGLAGSRRFARHGRAVLVSTIVACGVIALVSVLYVGVLVAVGRHPSADERQLSALSLAATIVACALVVPTSSRLRRAADRWVYGERTDPQGVITKLGARMTRAIPMDELLLQVVEGLRKSLDLTSAELWTGEHGRLVRVASMPERGTAVVELDPEAHHVVARSQAHGNAWLEMWLPELLVGRNGLSVRTVSIRHQGELLGLLVLECAAERDPFTTKEDSLLIDLARQLGLALHNVRLDSALEASIRQLEQRNIELNESRARIVAVADESRRRIERDLHDGAQQHLVALAAKVGLIRSMLDADPDAATGALDQLAQDITATIDELRELAHGIYPPRLRDRGLGEALETAAARSPRRTTVEAPGVGRYPPDIEAAVYFCCLEAIQNAVKHSGDDTSITVHLRAGANGLQFSVADDGSGFEASANEEGQGITNMRDRLGALGGELIVESQRGCGTTISGILASRPTVEPMVSSHRATPRRRERSSG